MAMYSDYDSTVSFEVLSTSPNPRKLFGSAMTREHAHMHTSTKRSVEAVPEYPRAEDTSSCQGHVYRQGPINVQSGASGVAADPAWRRGSAAASGQCLG